MKPKKRKKLIKIILICIILIVILSVVIRLIQIRQEEKNNANENEKLIEQQIDNYFSDKICPNNTMSLYSNYKGKNNKNDLYRNFKIFIDDLPTFISNIEDTDETELINYFEENKDNIYKYLGIDNKEEFLKLSEYLQMKAIDGKSFDYCEIEEDSFVTESEGKYLSFNVKFYFKNYTSDLKFKISFANGTKTEPQIKYNVAQ